MSISGSTASRDGMMDVTKLILNAGSTAIDGAALVSEVDREMPIASAALHAFLDVQNNFKTVRANKEDLEGLRQRCGHLIASVVEKCRESPTGLNLKSLEDCLRDAAKVVKRCGGRNKTMKALKATRDKGEIENFNKRIINLGNDMGLSGVMAILISNHKASSNKSDASSNKSDASSEEKEIIAVASYGGRNARALIWAGLYFGVWIIQRLSCNLGLPPNCELASKPLDVLTDIVVLFTFSLAQAWWCDLLERYRWEDSVQRLWIFIVVPVTAIVVSAIEWIRDLEPREHKYPGDVRFNFSHVQHTLYILGLIVVMFFLGWHFTWVFRILRGYEHNLFFMYTSSRSVLIVWAILCTYSLIVEGKGFNYRGALLAWVLSPIAVFTTPVSMLWLFLTTGIFIQSIGSNRLRFLGCDP